MVNIRMREAILDPTANDDGAAAAELALKAYIFESTPEILAGMTGGQAAMQQVADSVELTETPDDAVCSLVIDLMHYCEREKIDWTRDVVSRTREHFRSERVAASPRFRITSAVKRRA